MAPIQALHSDMRPSANTGLAGQRVEIVLEPLSHPELGAVRIEDEVFAIGRSESPFSAYPPELVADLSRRHARIFVEDGAAYLADLGSKNGTAVNGAAATQTIVRLRDGDELGLGKALSYVVRLRAMPARRAAPPRLASLTLQPESAGLEPIVIGSFPFLISKIDPAFTRYQEAQPHQVGYLSRRHAHIFLKGGAPYVEDLGSTNGTFIGAVRLDEHAQELQEGDVLAFGGRHFVYRVSLRWEQSAPEATVTRFSMAAAVQGKAQAPAGDAPASEKTTFIAAPGSFLDIFCVDKSGQRPQESDEQDDGQGPPGGATAGQRTAGGRRSQFTMLAAAMLEAFTGPHDATRPCMRTLGRALVILLLAAGLGLYLGVAPERELERLVASGNYADAAVLAAGRLARDPDNAELRTRGVEAVLKAELPQWIALLRARRFGQAAAVVARMQTLGRDNSDLKPLLAEIEWIGGLAQFLSARGGPDKPPVSPADQERIRLVLKQWQEDASAHQRAFASISSLVPAFRDTYAQAASDLRKLALVEGSLAGGYHGDR
jgi:pSer/pThr/pTyr-binding forkhead associated (FHA) protein